MILSQPLICTLLIPGLFDRVAVLRENWQEKLESETGKDVKERKKSKLDDLACYVYSSGTTGKPKGAFGVIYKVLYTIVRSAVCITDFIVALFTYYHCVTVVKE